MSPIPHFLCPHCGYDLRATPGDICSECGRRFDRATFTTGLLPWPKRREIGPIRAYLQTILMVTFRRRFWSIEANRDLSLADAARFFWITILIAQAAILTLSFKPPGENYFPGLGQVDNLPSCAPLWFTAIAIPAVWPTCLALWLLDITCLPRKLLREASPELPDRGVSLACYAIAPMLWTAPMAALIFLARMTIWKNHGYDSYYQVVIYNITSSRFLYEFHLLPLALAPAMLLTLISITIAHRRFTHATLSRALLTAATLLLRWLVSALLLLILLPFAIEYVRIAVNVLSGKPDY